MIKKLLSLTLFILASSYLSFAQSQWTQRANFAGTPGTALNFVIGTKGYAVMRGTTRDLWEWDQSTNTWAQKADYTGNSTSEQACFSIGTKGYLGTGYTSGNPAETKEFYEWDQATNVWTAKTNFGGVRRRMAVGFSIGTKGYIGSGQYYYLSTDTELSDFWEYDPAGDTWTQKANITGVRYNAAAFVIGSKAYVGTGQSSPSSYKNDLWEFDPVANTWTQKASLATARAGAMAFAIGTKGYVGLGGNGSGSLIDFWEWDQGNNTWLQVSNFPGTSRWLGGFAIGAKGYSNIGQSATDFWEFDPSAPVACNEHPVTAGLEAHTSNLYRYYSNLVGQGNNIGFKNNAPLADSLSTFYWQVNGVTVDTTDYFYNYFQNTILTGSVWFYQFNDTGTHIISVINKYLCQSDTAYDTIRVICPGVWVQKADVGNQVRRAAAGFTIGNKGYIGTGGQGEFVELADFWEWDKSTNVWTQKADYGGTPVMYASGFAVNDKGYFVGGVTYAPFSGPTVLYKSVWEYNPSTNAWVQKTDIPISVGRARGVAFSIGDKGYFGTGVGGSPVANRNDFWEYDAANDTWTQKANFGGGTMSDGGSFVLNGKGYVSKGNCGAVQLWEYDPSLNSWTQKTSCPTCVDSPDAFAIGNYGYIFDDGFTGDNDGRIWRYEPIPDTWTEMASVPHGTSMTLSPVVFTIGNNGYYGTGDANLVFQYKDFWEYYPDSCDAGLVTQVKPVEQTKTAVQVYPNPFTIQTTFSLTNEVKNGVLKIYDVSGREVKRVNFTGKQVIIEREGLQSGVYIYSLSSNTQILATGKLVIE